MSPEVRLGGGLGGLPTQVVLCIGDMYSTLLFALGSSEVTVEFLGLFCSEFALPVLACSYF